MKLLLVGCLFILGIRVSYAETKIVSFDQGIARQAEEAINLRQEQQASPEEINLYDEYVYDLEATNAEVAHESEVENFNNEETL
jgi:phosphate uptake regulator